MVLELVPQLVGNDGIRALQAAIANSDAYALSTEAWLRYLRDPPRETAVDRPTVARLGSVQPLSGGA